MTTPTEKMLRRYNFKLYPNRSQEAALDRQTVLLAWLWNAALEQRETQWRHECQRHGKGERKGIGQYDQSKELKFIRADDPEYEALSASSMELCLAALDEAFKSFYRRARGGAGKSSGYPRYKPSKPEGADWRSYHHDTIWHRNGSGWKIKPAGKHFRIYAKGVPGTIKARGRFPVDFDSFEKTDIRDMRIMRRDDAWYCSIVVRIDARRSVGEKNLEVAFDLIDEFATVKTVADGQCLPGWEGEKPSPDEQINPEYQGINQASAADAPDLRGDDRAHSRPARYQGGSAAPDSEGEDRVLSYLSAADAPYSAGEDRQLAAASSDSLDEDRRSIEARLAADDIQSEGDRRFKRGSYRWRQFKKRVAKRKAREARQRKDRLHRMTTALVSQSAEMAVICPPIRESTKSAKGNERAHGAAVRPVAMLNRHILGQAPAMAVQMLEYKAAEAGIPFARIEPDEHAVAIGRDLPVATKAARKARRKVKETEIETV